jgi:flagellar hook-associated protein 2
MSGKVSFTGLASGVQWGDLLDQLEAAERARRVSPIEQQATLNRQRIDAFSRFSSLVTTLSAAARTLRDGAPLDLFTAKVGTGPDGSTPLAATAAAGAQAATHTVEVVSLAQTEVWASASHATDAKPLDLAAGSFSINGVAIAVDGGDSLVAIRDRINTAADVGVRAAIVRVGEGEYRLSLTSTKTGADTIVLDGVTEGPGAELGFGLPGARTRAGSDAVVNIDGIEVRRGTNIISDAVAGLTLELSRVAGPVQVTVAKDEQSLVTAAKDFTSAFNAIRAFAEDQNSAPGRPLVRDPVLRQALSSFKDVLFTDATGEEAGALTRLALVGVAVDRDGRLQVDDAKLKAVAAAEPDALRALLNHAGGLMLDRAEDVARAETGSIAGRTRIMNETILTLGRRAEEARDRVDRMIERMTKDFLQMESALGRINAQGEWLAGQIDSLYRPSRD